MTSNYVETLNKIKLKADEFASVLTNINNLNNDLKERTEKLLKALGDIKHNKVTCKICYSRPPTHCVLPCGHAGICEQCAQRALNRNRCFTCRANIGSAVKIYM